VTKNLIDVAPKVMDMLDKLGVDYHR